MAGIADQWKAFSGFNNRDGLLIHPINTDFRRYLIHYGERVGAIGDGFNNVKASNSFALSRYPPEELFSHGGLQNGNPFKYQETKRKIFNLIWYQLLKFLEVPTIPRCTMVFTEYTWPKAQAPSTIRTVLAEVRRLVDKYAHNGEDVSITVTGHSLEVKSYQGELGEFRLVIDRDSALVNKSADVLPEKYKVPPNWRTVMNKGMIQMDNGFWKLNDCVPDPPSEDDIEGNITAIFLKDNMPPAAL
ncbi:phospholipase A1-II 4-like [Populus alba x Populus x berolinensis]|nr:phospholipase A1-II 4-like [Populus alba x Populus x berolinensis]